MNYNWPHSVVADLACVLPNNAAICKHLIHLLAQGVHLVIGLGRAQTEDYKAGEHDPQPKNEVEEIDLIGRDGVTKQKQPDQYDDERPHRNCKRSFKPRN